MKRLIGLMGYAGSGKDEACKQLGWARAAFADALKAKVDPLFPPDTPKEIKRETYVAYGRAMRKIDPDYWLKQLVLPDAEDVSITDVRYPNECKYVIERGGLVVLVNRPGVFAANDEESDSISAAFDEYSESGSFEQIWNTGSRERFRSLLSHLAGLHFQVPV